MSDKQAEMWAAFEAHKPEPAYAEAWATMLKKRTAEAVEAVWDAAPAGPVADAAWDAARAAKDAVAADRHAQDAIDAIKEVKP
jgi:hypothetical protein